MEERKLIRLGNSSFAIALPKRWIDKSNLKKGDKVFIVPNSNGEIIISSEFKQGEDKRIEIDVNGSKEDATKKNFHAAYIRGYNTIVLKGASKNNIKKIKELLNDYLSFEIIDTNEKEIIIKDFFDLKESKFENFVKRIDNNIKEMFDIIISEINKNKISNSSLQEILEIDKSINKFYFLCSRIFMQGVDNPTILNTLKTDGNKLFRDWWITFNSESLGDGLKYLIKWIARLNPNKKNDINDILLKLRENYIKSMDSFYKNNPGTASDIIEETKDMRKEIEKLEQNNLKIIKITEALELIRKNIYQNAKMILYMNY